MLSALQSDHGHDESARACKVWDRSAGADLLRSWFAGFLRSREIAEIDSIIQGEQGRGRGQQPRQQPEEREHRAADGPPAGNPASQFPHSRSLCAHDEVYMLCNEDCPKARTLSHSKSPAFFWSHCL